MYKIILVDDEEEVRKGILRKIQWQRYGFEIAGEAENGREALEIAEKTVPDVVITDIKMPFMDGLQLSQMLIEKFHTIKIILLTGFDEFKYAKKAIELNAAEYILKPISSDELIDILIKVKKQMDIEIAEKKDMQRLREYYINSLPILKEKFLTSLINGSIRRNEITEKSKIYNIDLDGNSFIISVVSVDYNSCRQFMEQYDLSRNEEIEFLKCYILNMTNEIVDKYKLGIVFFEEDKIVIITVNKEGNPEFIVDRTIHVLEEVRQSIEKFLKFTVSIGVGTTCNDISHINSSYQNALAALDYRIILGNNRIICIADIEPQPTEDITFDELKECELISCIKVGTEKEIGEIVDKLFEKIIRVKASFKEYQIYLLEILTTILKTAKASGVDMENIFGTNYNLFIELYKFDNIQNVKDWIKGIILKISNYIKNDREDVYKLLTQKAIEYIKSNYNESNMTINTVCQHLHISPAYFSYIFKKGTKMTFVAYLTQIRMDAAKELLRTTNMKTFIIADKVGYSEPNYFSYCFKRNIGISPTEYRNNFSQEMRI